MDFKSGGESSAFANTQII